jgi:hypothetical protein
MQQQQQVQPMYGMANTGQSVVNPQQYTAQQLLGLQAQVIGTDFVFNMTNPERD